MKAKARIHPHEALWLWRDMAGLAAEQAAKATGLSTMDYYSVEAGRTVPNDQTRVLIERVTDRAISSARWATGDKYPVIMRLGYAVEIMRRRVGMDMATCAKRLKTSTRVMVGVEGGLRSPQPDLLKAILTVFRDIELHKEAL